MACKICNHIKVVRHQKHSENISIPVPNKSWDRFTTNFVTELLESTKYTYTSILVIVDQFPKYIIYLLYQKDIDLPELAFLVFEHDIHKHGVS